MKIIKPKDQLSQNLSHESQIISPEKDHCYLIM